MHHKNEISKLLRQQEAEAVLSNALFLLGKSLISDEKVHVLPLLNDWRMALATFIELDVMQVLKSRFRLDDLSLKLIAITYINILEPDTLEPFLGKNWYEKGPTLTLERMLFLIQFQAKEKPKNIQLLLKNFQAFRWGILSLNSSGVDLVSSLYLVDDIFAYIVGRKEEFFHSIFEIKTKEKNLYIKECYLDILRNQPTQVNILSGMSNNTEKTAIVSELAVGVVDNWYRIDIEKGDNEDIEKKYSVLLHDLRCLILVSDERERYIYWPNFLTNCIGNSYYFKIVQLMLMQSKLTLFFDDVDEKLDNLSSIEYLRKKKLFSDQVIETVYNIGIPDKELLLKAWLRASDFLYQKYSDRLDSMNVEKTEFLISLYDIDPSGIESVVLEADQRIKDNLDIVSVFEVLRDVCLKQIKPIEGNLAVLTHTKHTLNDLVLPGKIREELQELIDRITYSKKLASVINDFLPGVQALFWGSPGTGKTMAAEAISSELKLPLYKINLANVASKWIGETEKHLSQLFNNAEKKNAVLLFDEADALFSKRSQIESSHDKNANMGVSFLLQRMETYKGLLLLSTNFKSNIDDAFLRRFHSIIEFSMPDETLRLILWEKMWGSNYVLESDISLNFLAKEFDFTPSQIRNIVDRSILFAVKQNQNLIEKSSLGTAIMRELDKHSAGFLADKKLSKWLKRL